jgi:hypothetical protein
VNGRYPKTLDELIPRFIGAVPRGIMDGQRAQYTTLPSGARQIYFLGQNGRDDGGKGDDNTLELPDA